MSNKKIVLVYFFILIVCLVLFVVRSSNPKQYQTVTRVSVILPQGNDAYWTEIAKGIQEERDSIGNKYGIDIKILIPQINFNVQQMTDILNQQIAAKVDVIVVQGNKDDSFLETLNMALDQGIKIICIDTDISSLPDHLYIGTDNYEAGQMIGQKLIEITGGRAEVTVITGDPLYQNLELRYKGLEEAVSSFPEISIKNVEYDNYDGLTFMKLYQSPHMTDTLVCLEGTGAKTLDAMQETKNKEYSYILGFDHTSVVKKGLVNGVIIQDMNGMGRKVVTEIAHYLETGTFTKSKIYTKITWVTQDNYEAATK